MTTNRYYKGTPAELDAQSKVILIENSLDAMFEHAVEYAHSIRAEKSRAAVLTALADLQYGDMFTLPAEMPQCDRESVRNAYPIKRVIGAVNALAKYKRLAGALISA